MARNKQLHLGEGNMHPYNHFKKKDKCLKTGLKVSTKKQSNKQLFPTKLRDLIMQPYVPKIMIGVGVAKKVNYEKKCVVISSPHSLKQFKRIHPDVAFYRPLITRNVTLKVINRVVKESKKRKASRIIAIGLGTVIDCAKVVSSRTNMLLQVIPTALSCNVFATNKSTITTNEKLQTITSKTPDEVYVDFSLISKAPKRMNYAGIGDLLSIHTALRDWKIASEQTKEKIDQKTCAYAEAILACTIENRERLRSLDNNALELLFKLLLTAGYLTIFYGSGRPESGSEHIFASAIKSNNNSGKALHGELVSLGILLMKRLQKNPDARIKKMIDEFNLTKKIKKPLFTKPEFISFLEHLKTMRPDRYTVLNSPELTERSQKNLIREFIKRGFVK